MGLDLSQHSETAYTLGGSAYAEYPTSGAVADPRKAAEAKARTAQ